MTSLRECYTASDRRNQMRFLYWTITWGVAFLLATWTLTRDFELATPLAWLIAAIPLLPALAALLAFMRFLREADELVYRIQTEGLAIGFGVGVFAGLGYTLAERIGAPQLEGDVAIALFMFSWAIGQLLARRRYL